LEERESERGRRRKLEAHQTRPFPLLSLFEQPINANLHSYTTPNPTHSSIPPHSHQSHLSSTQTVSWSVLILPPTQFDSAQYLVDDDEEDIPEVAIGTATSPLELLEGEEGVCWQEDAVVLPILGKKGSC